MEPDKPHFEIRLISLPAIYTLICLLSAFAFIHAHYLAIPLYVYPLIPLVTGLLFVIISTAFFEYPRFWLLRRLGRVFLSPLLQVDFTDFIFGYQMNSLVQVLEEFEYTIYYYTKSVVNLTAPNAELLNQCTNTSRIFHHITY